jgi:23S rRNA pseudouridine1911/1915/1917 synthase
MNSRETARSFTINDKQAGQRLDLIVSELLTNLSRSKIQNLIADGKVLCNGLPGNKSDRLKQGDSVQIIGSGIIETVSILTPQEIPISVLFEDEHLAVVNKPAGLVVHPGNGNPDSTLVNALLYKIGTLSEGTATKFPGIVHRLDKETSGVLVTAKTNEAHSALSELFSDRKVDKVYVGFCIGAQPEQHGLIELPLGRSRRDPLKRAVMTDGKPALTEYWCLKTKSGISAMRFKLFTGRTHQIRIHCSHKGFPIVGDILYGGGKERVLRLQPVVRPFAYSFFKCFNRHALHARSISFIHPFTKKELTVTAPLPEDFLMAKMLFEGIEL